MDRFTVAAVLPVLLCVLCPLNGSGQEPFPGWRWQADGLWSPAAAPAADSTWRFEQMPPGWHITTGPAGILYPPAERAVENFSLTADFVVFPATADAGFGLFIGGAALGTDSASYVAGLLRRDGMLSVVRRARGVESVLVPWTAHGAIKPHPGTGVVSNRLRLNASADSLRIIVNDSVLVRLPLPHAVTTGGYGFRIGERVNAHLTILDYTRHLAPARSR